MLCCLDCARTVSSVSVFSLEMSTTHTSLAVKRKANAQRLLKYKGTQDSCPGIGCWRWVSSFLISQAVGETKGTMTKVMGFVQEARKANKWTGCSWWLICKRRNIRWDSLHKHAQMECDFTVQNVTVKMKTPPKHCFQVGGVQASQRKKELLTQGLFIFIHFCCEILRKMKYLVNLNTYILQTLNSMSVKNFKKLFLEGGERRTRTAFSI